MYLELFFIEALEFQKILCIIHYEWISYFVGVSNCALYLLNVILNKNYKILSGLLFK